MKLARKQFDQSNATKVKRRGKFRLPAPRIQIAPDVLHEIPPWSPRSDDYEIPDDYEYVSDDEGDEEFSRDANQHFGFLGLDE